jgi:putative transposase
MYNWRKMSEAERGTILARRKVRGGTWRRPPAWNLGSGRYMITAACFEHAPYIGESIEPMRAFERELLAFINDSTSCVFAHVILPNHYHVLVECPDVLKLKKAIGQFHGRTSYLWNKEESLSGRKIFHGSAETAMKSERHFEAPLNYIHNNPVKHGYAKKWQDWPYSSARQYLAAVGKEEALRHWLEYPTDRYGAKWDQ